MKIEDFKLAELVEIGVFRLMDLKRINPDHEIETNNSFKAVDEIMTAIRLKVESMKRKKV